MKLIIDNEHKQKQRAIYNIYMGSEFNRYSLDLKLEILRAYFEKIDRKEQARQLLKQRQQTPAANDGVLLR
jgi:uncharacterized protein (UPF0335 family)